MHTVKVKLIADQEIYIYGEAVNIHDVKTVVVSATGQIIQYYLKKREQPDSR